MEDKISHAEDRNGSYSEEYETTCFQIISNAGTAKSLYINAIEKAKCGDFDEAEKLCDEAGKYFLDCHKIHADVIQKEASGQSIKFSLLLMHAEDQLTSAETVKVLAKTIIDLYKKQ